MRLVDWINSFIADSFICRLQIEVEAWIFEKVMNSFNYCFFKINFFRNFNNLTMYNGCKN